MVRELALRLRMNYEFTEQSQDERSRVEKKPETFQI